jgi:CheY-like chemotaxis protein
VTADFQRRRFLVVDDEVFSRDIVRRMVSGLNPAEVVVAGDGAAALDTLQRPEAPFDCVVTDFNMQPMNGLQLLKHIRVGTGRVKRELPVVMVTGHTDAALVGTALALDANGFIAKPVSRNTLVDRLTRAFTEPAAVRQSLAYSVIPVPSVDEILRAAERAQKPPPVGDVAAEPAARRGPSVLLRSTASSGGGSAPIASSGNEICYSLANVPEDAILARALSTRTGTVLLAADNALNRRMLSRLRDIQEIYDVITEVWVKAK